MRPSFPLSCLTGILLLLAAGCRPSVPSSLTLCEGDSWTSRQSFSDFELNGQARCSADAQALIRICGQPAATDGYEVLLHNGPIDGSLKTGSLLHVRNLYRSLVQDGEWFDFSVAVRGRNVGVRINGVDVVCYTEPEQPWRAPGHEEQRIAPGHISLQGCKDTVLLRNLTLTPLP